MTRKFNSILFAALLCLAAPAAQAQSTNDVLIERLQSEGYEYIEIKVGLTQTKVEAIRGTEKLEFTFDQATGEILKQEVERADSDEIGRTGVEIDRRDRDFVDVGGNRRDDDRRGDRRGRDDDDDDDDSRSGSDDDDRRDGDDRGRGGSDDDGDHDDDHDSDDDDDDDDDGDDSDDDDDDDDDR
ncbi:PepSY domain-containing protein [Jannaschia pohangensis]|uniref:Peptidase propeptide and YPEB domain-containing protein n=1 Tax=Jannaschia pohangensis TaxID=390807 RepID=A0A1I3JPB3_9RHOB|nr:PepSY domain-containing protein [Jannaschia pohangensis]SFI62083.1 hypothetical protein SAMN04488095_1385 [Jannaschia pohangensis]